MIYVVHRRKESYCLIIMRELGELSQSYNYESYVIIMIVKRKKSDHR